MLPEDLEEFAVATITDNRLVALALSLGEVVSLSEIIELSAWARGIYDLVSLDSRRLDRLADRLELWQHVSDLARSARRRRSSGLSSPIPGPPQRLVRRPCVALST